MNLKKDYGKKRPWVSLSLQNYHKIRKEQFELMAQPQINNQMAEANLVNNDLEENNIINNLNDVMSI